MAAKMNHLNGEELCCHQQWNARYEVFQRFPLPKMKQVVTLLQPWA